MSVAISREKLGWRVCLESGLQMDVMDGRHDLFQGLVHEPDPMARTIVFDRRWPSNRAELHQLAEALREIERQEVATGSGTTATAAPPIAEGPVPSADEPKTDVCPVCGAHGRQHCSTKYGKDHKARALGWSTARRPKD